MANSSKKAVLKTESNEIYSFGIVTKCECEDKNDDKDDNIDDGFTKPEESEKHYTYDIKALNDNGISQMRFELGDTAVEGGSDTSALCDEEYQALITRALFIEKKSWKYAKFLCLQAIVMKLSYEVDYKADSISISLSQRYKNWKVMYDEQKKEDSLKANIPTSIGASIKGGSYFTLGMQSNPRALTIKEMI